MLKPSTYAASLLLPLALVLISGGCSSATEPEASVGESEEALGEATCASATPEQTFSGRVPDYVSRDGYGNAHCYKGLVLSVTNWAQANSDLMIKGWSLPDAATSSQAECEGLHLWADVYLRTGSHTQHLKREAAGTWTTWTPPVANAGPIPVCLAPELIFGGSTFRTSDADTFYPGETYTIAASYRSHGVTLAVEVRSEAARCGQSGSACCRPDVVNGACTTSGMVCTSGTCQLPPPCGAQAQMCCAGSVCNGGLSCQSGACNVPPPCGGQSQQCCNGSACNGGLTCQSGACAQPPACGGASQQCCNGSSCNSGLTCQSGACRVPPVVCGAQDQQCCNGTGCNAGLTCQSGACKRPCGAVGTMCCPQGNACKPGLTCEAGIGGAPTCGVPSVMCGVEGLPCCDGLFCNQGTCDGFVCQ